MMQKILELISVRQRRQQRQPVAPITGLPEEARITYPSHEVRQLRATKPQNMNNQEKFAYYGKLREIAQRQLDEYSRGRKDLDDPLFDSLQEVLGKASRMQLQTRLREEDPAIIGLILARLGEPQQKIFNIHFSQLNQENGIALLKQMCACYPDQNKANNLLRRIIPGLIGSFNPPKFYAELNNFGWQPHIPYDSERTLTERKQSQHQDPVQYSQQDDSAHSGSITKSR